MIEPLRLDAGRLAAVAHLPERCPAPVVVCCHGLLSSKESSKYKAIGETMSLHGLAVVRFDFSGCGESETCDDQDLLSCRRRDLETVLEDVRSRPWAKGRIGLLGSSLGGYLALLTAASQKHPVHAVVCWATPCDLRKVHLSEEIQEAGERDQKPGNSFSSWTQGKVPLKLENLHRVSRALVIHGKQDQVVEWDEASAIYREVAEPKRLLLMETAEHRFLDLDCRNLAIQASLDWFLDQGLLDPV